MAGRGLALIAVDGKPAKAYAVGSRLDSDLVLQFSDQSIVTSGRRHFFSYVYGPSFVEGAITPAGLKTDAGIGIGSTVAELTGTYPSAVINPGDDFGGPNFFINDGLAGFLTGTEPTSTVTSVLGGQGCGG